MSVVTTCIVSNQAQLIEELLDFLGGRVKHLDVLLVGSILVDPPDGEEVWIHFTVQDRDWHVRVDGDLGHFGLALELKTHRDIQRLLTLIRRTHGEG